MALTRRPLAAIVAASFALATLALSGSAGAAATTARGTTVPTYVN